MADFLAASIAGPVVIVPQQNAEAVGLDGLNQALVGSGPFKLVWHDLVNKIVLERHEDYFQAALPHLARVEIVITEDAMRLKAPTGRPDGPSPF